MQRKDYFTELKMRVVVSNYDFMKLRENIVCMLETNRWILEDINLCESFCHLQEMVESSCQELIELIEEIKALDDNGIAFSIYDLIEYFDYIKKNIDLEFMYFMNMYDYMTVVTDYSIQGEEIVDRCNQYDKNDSIYLNQMKLNNDGLKKLKKERRDFFE